MKSKCVRKLCFCDLSQDAVRGIFDLAKSDKIFGYIWCLDISTLLTTEIKENGIFADCWKNNVAFTANLPQMLRLLRILPDTSAEHIVIYLFQDQQVFGVEDIRCISEFSQVSAINKGLCSAAITWRIDEERTYVDYHESFDVKELINVISADEKQ